MGFERKPTLTFVHEPLATSSTCDLQLRIPIIHGSNYNKFEEALVLSMKGNDGFESVTIITFLF